MLFVFHTLSSFKTLTQFKELLLEARMAFCRSRKDYILSPRIQVNSVWQFISVKCSSFQETPQDIIKTIKVNKTSENVTRGINYMELLLTTADPVEITTNQYVVWKYKNMTRHQIKRYNIIEINYATFRCFN